ncbi:MAG: helix-hairpin-helix domain-containing protein [Candidatus Electronema sp. V4]|uniref:helix-hairpin-helix domain-containing protein n=1 Tax=Candidatus Electronema sp. V4 TaxID=3454756 RepID=UPI00405559C0
MHFDLNDFLNSSSESNPLEDISSSADKIVSKIDELCKKMPKIDSIAASTGINLSVSTLRNLHLLLHNDTEFKYKNINECTTGELREIFGIDGQLAANIRHHYTFNNVSEIKNISGMTDELLEKINNYIKKADNFS